MSQDRAAGTLVRHFQVAALLSLAVALWCGIYLFAWEGSLPRGSIAGALTEVTTGSFGERWYTFVALALAHGHAPVLVALAVWAAVTTGRTVTAGGWPGRPERGVPLVLLFWGALALGGFCRWVAYIMVPAGTMPGSTTVGPAFLAALVWWVLAVVAVVAGWQRSAAGRRQLRQDLARSRRSGRPAARRGGR